MRTLSYERGNTIPTIKRVTLDDANDNSELQKRHTPIVVKRLDAVACSNLYS